MTITWTGNKIDDNNNNNDNKSGNKTQKTKVKRNANYEMSATRGAINKLGKNVHCHRRRQQAEFF